MTSLLSLILPKYAVIACPVIFACRVESRLLERFIYISGLDSREKNGEWGEMKRTWSTRQRLETALEYKKNCWPSTFLADDSRSGRRKLVDTLYKQWQKMTGFDKWGNNMTLKIDFWCLVMTLAAVAVVTSRGRRRGRRWAPSAKSWSGPAFSSSSPLRK